MRTRCHPSSLEEEEPTPVPIDFDKLRALDLFDRVTTAKPLAPVRTAGEILALAGACLNALIAAGPPGGEDSDYSKMPTETLEATIVRQRRELHTALDYYADLLMMALKSQYDEHYDLQHEAVVEIDGDGMIVIPLKGMRKPPPA